MEEIIVYTNKSCAYCKQVKDQLKINNIKFEERDTLENEQQWQQIIELTGYGSVPVIFFKDNYFLPGRDYRSPENLINILKNFKASLFSEKRQILERIKTLNYNINVAFGRTDQILRQLETKINTNEHKSTD